MIVRLLVVFAAVEVGLPIVFYFLRNRLLFFPSATPVARAGLPFIGTGVDATLVSVARPDGRRLAAYDARPSGAAAQAPTVLFLHGNAGNLASRAELLGEFVRGTRTRTLMLDYSGYGGNDGSPSEAEVVSDGLAGFDHLVATGSAPEHVVIYGESIGGAVALAVAAQRRPAGVVLQSTFASLASMARRIYWWLPLAALMVRGSFRSLDRLREYDGPLRLVHGNRDRIVPYAESVCLAAAAAGRAELWTIEGADHNDLFEVAGDAYLRRLGETFAAWTAPRR